MRTHVLRERERERKRERGRTEVRKQSSMSVGKQGSCLCGQSNRWIAKFRHANRGPKISRTSDICTSFGG